MHWKKPLITQDNHVSIDRVNTRPQRPHKMPQNPRKNNKTTQNRPNNRRRNISGTNRLINIQPAWWRFGCKTRTSQGLAAGRSPQINDGAFCWRGGGPGAGSRVKGLRPRGEPRHSLWGHRKYRYIVRCRLIPTNVVNTSTVLGVWCCGVWVVSGVCYVEESAKGLLW